MTIKTSIHITLLWVAFLMAFPVAAQVLCDMTGHQEEVPLCAGNGTETETSDHDDCRDDGCCGAGCLNCGLSCCTGLSYILTPPVRTENINGLNGRFPSLDQRNFWVGLDPFYHPPRA